MSAAIDLYIDIQSQPGRLVAGLAGGSPPPLTGVYQGSHLNLRIFPVRPTGVISGGNPYAAVAAADIGGVKVAVGARAGTGSPLALAGDGTIYPFAAQAAADAEGLSNYWYGELNLNTTELNSAIGTLDSYAAFLEVHLSIAGVYRVVYQVPITVYASVIPPTGAVTVPTSTAEYLTRDEIFALFVAWDSRGVAANAGRNVILVSPDGGSTRELGVGNDKGAIDNLT